MARDSGLVALARALDAGRHAKVGFGAGVVFAAGLYAYRVLGLAGPVSDTRGSPLLFLLLAAVLAVSAGALVTVLLSLRSAVRLAREFDR